MNYISLLEREGLNQASRIIKHMEEECELLVKRGEDDWYTISKGNDKAPIHEIKRVISRNNVINWGNRIFRDDDLFKVNKPSAINRASNKSLSRRLLQEVGTVPRTWFDIRDIVYPCIARPERHTLEENFYVLNNKYELYALMAEKDIESWYFSEIFDKTNEYRVHCTHGKVLIVNEKNLRKDHGVNISDNDGDWPYIRWSNYIPQLCRAALISTQALGLDYSAVDIMFNSRTREAKVCEINTSPGIYEYSASRYAKYFDWLIRHDFPKNHFKFDHITRGMDFAWTNEQLAD